MKSPKAKAFDLVLSSARERKTRQEQQRFARCAAEFISLISVKETQPKKTLCAKGKSGKSVSRGFFYGTSMSHRKTPHIHVRRPPGLQAGAGSSGSLEAGEKQGKS